MDMCVLLCTLFGKARVLAYRFLFWFIATYLIMTIRLIMLFSQAFKCVRLEYYANYHHCISGCLPPANFFIPPGILDPAEDVYRPEESITFSCSSEYNFFGIPLSTCSEADGFIFPGTEDNICLQGRCFSFLFCIHPKRDIRNQCW